MPDDAISTDMAATLGEALVSLGKIDRAGLQRAERWCAQDGGGLHRIVTSLGLVSEQDMAEVLSRQLGLPLVGARDFPDEKATDRDLSVAFLRKARILPLDEAPDRIVIAMADPFDDFSLRAMELACRKPVSVAVAAPSEVEQAIERIYGDGASAIADIVAKIGDDDLLDADAERLEDLASEAPVIRLVNRIVSRAVEMRASDVHVEPFENRLRIRYRVDGVLHDVESPPLRLRHAINSRIKIMSKLDIAERRLPQDGRIKLVVRGRETDLRVSTVPTMYGESVVLRILDKSSGVIDFPKLGFDDDTLARYLGLIDRPNGIVLVTGPTGSGKTTTLYASLRHLNTDDRKILTVEDPVEYQLEGVNQIQVKPQIGLAFADVLRSMLRQDPDIMMIGEIRDLETAQIAVQASLTGHLVLSTLHTNSAAASVTRLLDMGVEDFLVTSTLAGIVAQRLVRNLCRHCREPYSPPATVLERFRRSGADAPGIDRLFRPRGCEECNGTGYHGRSCIAEVLVMDETISKLIQTRARTEEIERRAIEAGMRSIFDDGLLKVANGRTSIEEVLRVTRDTTSTEVP